jgi:nitroreductase
MYEDIIRRSSVRSYEKKFLLDSDKEKIMKILECYKRNKGPFEHQADFFFIENETHSNKIGTYGFIKNAPAFIGGSIHNSMKAMVDYGFLFEQIILELTHLNLGTCWLGGTFKRNEFDKELEPNHIIPAISPVGYPTNPSIREKVIRRFANADNRKPLNTIFFSGEALDTIDENDPYIKYLKAVQAGPSASNKQPWRIILANHQFHVFLERTKGYGSQLKIDIQAIDIGIALAHLYLSLKEDGYQPVFVENKPFDFNDNHYIISILTSK